MKNHIGVSNRTLGGRIANLRSAADISQEKFAHRVGVSRETIRRFESNQRIPRSDVLIRIAQALEVDPGDLLREEVA